MLKEISYKRAEAVRYAETWAMLRNPRFPNFDQMGGDCTNFASQCIYAGCGVMNPTPVTGWYCNSLDSRSAAWSGVEFLFSFLTSNRSVGPYAAVTGTDMLQPGDVIQLGDPDGHFYHTPVVLSVENGTILVAAHTFDACFRPLYTYSFAALRCLHIAGARSWA